MERKKVFLDMDGVLMDWNSSAISLLNLEDESIVKGRMRQGENLEDICPEVDQLITDEGIDFWKNIRPFSWAQELYSYLQETSDLYILTSSGRFQKRGAEYIANSISGKLQTLEKYFPSARPTFTCEKYVCADVDSYLVDDSDLKMKKFIQNGGKGFLWPHEYVVEERGFNSVFEDLKYSLN